MLFCFVFMSGLLIPCVLCEEISLMKEKIDHLQNTIELQALVTRELVEEVLRQKDTITKLTNTVQEQAYKLTNNDKVITELQQDFQEMIDVINTRSDQLSEANLPEVHIDELNTPNEYSNRNQPIEGVQEINRGIGRSNYLKNTTGRMKMIRNAFTARALNESEQVSNTDVRVAFHAVNTLGETSHVGLKQSIVYDGITLNIGGAFHSSLGLFTTPVAGLYLFSTTILSMNSKYSTLCVQLVKNGGLVAAAYAHGGDGLSKEQGSVTATMQLSIGDEVWVRSGCNPDTSYYGDWYTSFTGVLISQF